MTFYPFLVLEARNVPLGPNFLQLDISEPSSGFTPGLRSTSFLFSLLMFLLWVLFVLVFCDP
jgi:hypothetical protein